jgi:predicted house-cleaning noncanonical NTP pyrophosphatase (MazG superfamily)
VEFRVALRQKLQEEVDEFLDSDNPWELADIIEVILALAEHMGISPEALESLREKKATERGIFQERIILE